MKDFSIDLGWKSEEQYIEDRKKNWLHENDRINKTIAFIIIIATSNSLDITF